MLRAPDTLANTKSAAALGGAPGSWEPAQIKTHHNQHTGELNQAMPVRHSTMIAVHSPVAAVPVHV